MTPADTGETLKLGALQHMISGYQECGGETSTWHQICSFYVTMSAVRENDRLQERQ
jgi:hypothetical protein